jgi:protease secretion system outer membrane protein
LDVLLADKALATSRRDLAQAKYNYMISLIKLKQLAGNLSLEDLEKIALHFEKDRR